MAVIGGVEAAVQLHVDRGDDLNARDDRGLTPLMLAASRNRARICRVLIEAGADMSARDGAGNDALSIAQAAGAAECAAEIEAAMRVRAETCAPHHEFVGGEAATKVYVPSDPLVPLPGRWVACGIELPLWLPHPPQALPPKLRTRTNRPSLSTTQRRSTCLVGRESPSRLLRKATCRSALARRRSDLAPGIRTP